MASGKTELKGGRAGTYSRPTDLQKRSSGPLLTLTPHVFLPTTPTGVEFQSLKNPTKTLKLNLSLRRHGLQFNGSEFAFILRN